MKHRTVDPRETWLSCLQLRVILKSKLGGIPVGQDFDPRTLETYSEPLEFFGTIVVTHKLTWSVAVERSHRVASSGPSPMSEDIAAADAALAAKDYEKAFQLYSSVSNMGYNQHRRGFEREWMRGSL